MAVISLVRIIRDSIGIYLLLRRDSALQRFDCGSFFRDDAFHFPDSVCLNPGREHWVAAMVRRRDDLFGNDLDVIFYLKEF